MGTVAIKNLVFVYVLLDINENPIKISRNNQIPGYFYSIGYQNRDIRYCK